jgi:hypothetical protein
MASQWYYINGNQRYGPVSSAELKSLAIAGRLTQEALVWREGMANWAPASNVKGLFDVTPASAPLLQPLTTSSPISPAPSPTQPVSSTEQPTSNPTQSMFGTLKGVVGGTVNALQSPLKPTTEAPPSVLPDRETSKASKSEAAGKKSTTNEPPSRLPANVALADVILQCQVAYRGGHPLQTDDGAGTLYMAQSGIYYVDANPSQDISMPYEHIVDILAPIQGSYSPEMLSKSNRSKSLSSATKHLGRFAGGLLGGTEGRLLRAATQTASGLASDQAKLGPLPKNRLIVVLIIETVKHKVMFDVMAPTTEIMEQQADQFWRRVASVRSKFFTPASKLQAQNSDPLGRSSVAPQVATDGKGFFISRNGFINGPFSISTIQAMIADGEIAPTDCIRIEMWLPIGTLGLFGASTLLAGGNAPIGSVSQFSNTGVSNPGPEATRQTGQSILSIADAVADGFAAARIVPKAVHSVARAGRSLGSDDQGESPSSDIHAKQGLHAPGIDSDYNGPIDGVGINAGRLGRIVPNHMDLIHEDQIDPGLGGMDTNYDESIDTPGQDGESDSETDNGDQDDNYGDFDDE